MLDYITATIQKLIISILSISLGVMSSYMYYLYYTSKSFGYKGPALGFSIALVLISTIILILYDPKSKD